MKTGSLLKIILISGTAIILLFCGYLSSKNHQYEKHILAIKSKSNLADPVQATVNHKKLQKGENSVHYFVSGDPENEAIVFLHPAFADHSVFDQQIDFFSEKYYVITVDMPGHGQSQMLNADIKLKSSPELIKEILEQENKAAAHLAGASLGSIIARQFSQKYPQKTLSLTGTGSFDTRKESKEIKLAQLTEGLKWIPRILFSMKSFRRYAASVTVIDPVQQVKFYESMSGFTRSSFRCMSGIEYFSREHENSPRTFPLLILYGDHDLDIAQTASRSWHENEKGSQLHKIKNAGHCANMDNAQEFNQVLMDFLTSVSDKNSAPLTAEN